MNGAKANVILLLLGTPALLAFASPENEAAAAKAAEATSGSNGFVCKKLPPPVGTRIGKRQVCKTRAEWRALEQAQQDDLQKLQSLRSRDAPGRGFGASSSGN